MTKKQLKTIVTLSLVLTLIFAVGMMTNVSAKALGTSEGSSGDIKPTGPTGDSPWWTPVTTDKDNVKDPDTNPSTGPQDFMSVAFVFSAASTIFSAVALAKKKN